MKQSEICDLVHTKMLIADGVYQIERVYAEKVNFHLLSLKFSPQGLGGSGATDSEEDQVVKF